MSDNFILTQTPEPRIDTRDKLYAAPGLAPNPTRIDLRLPAQEMENQGGLGSCSENAAPSACEYLALIDGITVDLSRLFGLYECHQIEGFSGYDGAFLRDVMSVGHKLGIPNETTWPYDESKVDTKPSQEAYAEALKQKIGRYESIPLAPTNISIGIYNMKSALAQGLPIVIAFHLQSWFYNLIGPLVDHRAIWLQGGFNQVGNHAVMIVGYDDAIGGGSWIIQNSWGAEWGDGGFGALNYSCTPQIYEAWVIRDFMDCGIRYTPEETQIAQLYVALFGRAPDNLGLIYWQAALMDGMTIKQIAAQMFATPDARPYYPSTASNAQIVASMYVNVLGRSPDSAGLQYWTAELDGSTPGDVIVNMLVAVQTYSGDVPEYAASRQLFINKVDVALFCGVTLACSDLAICKSALASVTAETTSVGPAKAHLRELIA